LSRNGAVLVSPTLAAPPLRCPLGESHSAPGSARRIACALGIAAVAALAACATPSSRVESPAATTAAAGAFTAEGRISARRGNEGVAGQFTWRHEPPRDTIDLTSPLGQTIARLEGDTQSVRIERSDGRNDAAQDWDTLTERSLGVTLPVTGLSSWLQGAPRDGTQFTLERDARNRPSLLRQDGWEVAYAYGDDGATRAARLTLRYAGTEPIEVRIAVDRWQ